jgi:hypothetical protein
MIEVTGAYDLHIHSAPCLFPRLADDLTVSLACATAHMRGIVLKSHHESTVGRAAVVNAALGDRGLSVYGSITLNHAVGGINPAAVDAALRTGARIVWMPTVDSAAHALAFGVHGHWDVQRPLDQQTSTPHQPKPLNILHNGQLIDSASEILALCQQYDVALATGHLGQLEIRALVQAAQQRRFQRLIITHPLFRVPGFAPSDLQVMATEGIYFEFTYCSVSPMWRHTTIDECVNAVHVVGADHAFFSSDGGQTHNPMPHEGIRLLAQMSLERGLHQTEVEKMIRTVPARLLDR